MERQDRNGRASCGMVQHGSAGMAGYDMDGLGLAGQEWLGPAGRSADWRGKAWQDWLGVARHVRARLAMERQRRNGLAGQVLARQVLARNGTARQEWQGKVRPGENRPVAAGIGQARLCRSVGVRQGLAGHGEVGQERHGLAR